MIYNDLQFIYQKKKRLDTQELFDKAKYFESHCI